MICDNHFFLVFQEVFLSISGFRNLRCWKCHEPKKWISKKIGRFTSKLSLDSATPLDPLTQAPEDFASSKQYHGSGLPVAVLVFWFQVLWAEKFQKNVKIGLKGQNSFVGTIQRFVENMYKNSVYADKNMCTLSWRIIYAHFDITNQAHFTASWKIWICAICVHIKKIFLNHVVCELVEKPNPPQNQ